MTMWISILLLLSFTKVLDSFTVTFKNKCDYKVLLDAGPFEILYPFIAGTFTLYPLATCTYNATFLRTFDISWNIKTGCFEKGNNCETGNFFCKPRTECSDSIVTVVQLDLLQIPAGNRVLTLQQYSVRLQKGYNVPVRVSVIGGQGRRCTPILCNVTLDKCPKAEIDNIGDLRVIKDDRTVACQNPCVKNATAFGKFCEGAVTEEYKYGKLLQSKCSYEDSNEDFEYEVRKTCSEGTGYVVTTCP